MYVQAYQHQSVPRCQTDTYKCKPSYGPCEEHCNCVIRYQMSESEAVCTYTIGGTGGRAACACKHLVLIVLVKVWTIFFHQVVKFIRVTSYPKKKK